MITLFHFSPFIEEIEKLSKTDIETSVHRSLLQMKLLRLMKERHQELGVPKSVTGIQKRMVALGMIHGTTAVLGSISVYRACMPKIKDPISGIENSYTKKLELYKKYLG